VSRLGRLWRTTTFQLTAIFIILFVVFAIGILGYIAYQSSITIQQAQVRGIERELNRLEREYRRGGTRGLVVAIQRIARGAGPGIYFVADQNGVGVAGNIATVPFVVLDNPGQHTFTYQRDRPFRATDPDAEADTTGVALVRSFILPSGYRLVVGRDIVERRGFAVIIFQAFFWGVIMIVILSIIAGVFTARRVLRRLDAIADTSNQIMSGNLSQRVPVTRRNDEFDRLATNLNAMLDRIEQLMQGMKQVTDNIAHDLKTPLTRMRNKVERALHGNMDEQSARSALEATIAESDQLLKTFNALLLIARIEAGAPASALVKIQVAEMLTDLVELYAPVAEDAGLVISADAPEGLELMANRELVGQALVNLIENAIKYAQSGNPGDQNVGQVTVRARRGDRQVIFEVADQGPGIPEKERERVLKRFVRLEESRTEPGSGLGLSLVAAVARLHKGQLEILSNDPGTLIRLSLPADPAE
jgi:signal transduction histidine kinase